MKFHYFISALLLCIFLSSPSAHAQDPAGFELIRYEITYNDTNTAYVLDKMTVAPNAPYANTGLAYHPEEHFLFSSTYNGNNSSWIEKINKDNSCAGDCLLVLPPVYQIQGLTFDRSDDTFWVWGRDIGGTGIIFHLDYDGNDLGDNIPINMYGGSLEYDYWHDYLWVKPYSPNGTMLYIYDLHNGSQLYSLNTAVGGEGVSIDPFDGNYWIANELTVFHKLRGTTTTLASFPNPSDSSYWGSVPPDTFAGAAEGLVVDPSDRTLWFNADQNFHGNRPDGNLCWHLDPFNVYNEKMHIPGGMNWSKGVCIDTYVYRNRLKLRRNFYEGFFITPIIDFRDYSPSSDYFQLSEDGYVYGLYRGSNTPPTTEPEPSRLCLDYYDANNENYGWGDTVPSDWGEEIPDYRYIQVKFHLFRLHIPDNENKGEEFVSDQIISDIELNPNPFNQRVAISYQLLAVSRVNLMVYDIMGREISKFEILNPKLGENNVVWNAEGLVSGVYFVRLEAREFKQVKKLLLIK